MKIKLAKGWIEETMGSKKVLKKIYKYKQSDSMDMINFAGDISELPNYKTNIDFNFGDQKGIALVFDKKTNLEIKKEREQVNDFHRVG